MPLGLGKRFSSKSKLSLIDEYKEAQPERSPLRRTGTFRQQQPQDDLHATIRQHEIIVREQKQMIDDQSSIIERIQTEENLLHTQVWTAKEETIALRNQIPALEEQVRNLDWQYQVSNGNMNELKDVCNRKHEELSAQSNTIKFLSGHNQQLQQRVVHMERIVASTSQQTGTDVQAFFDRYAEMETAHHEAITRLEAESGTIVELRDAIEILESENASLKTVIGELGKDALGSENCQPQTLRSLLTMRLVDQALAGEDTDSVDAAEGQNWVPSGLPEKALDLRCSPDTIQDFANLLPTGPGHDQFYRRLELKVCDVCSKPKFKLKTQPRQFSSTSSWLDEYLGKTRYFSCCYEQVCKECFGKHVLKTLRQDWWYKLSALQWFPCPQDGCEKALGIRCEADLEICLERSCGIEAEEHVKMYVKALTFRKALETMDPEPNDEALKKAATLAENLATADRMYSLFNPRFDGTMVDETGCIPEFNPGTILNASMDSGPSVPIFLKFIRRQARPKTCIVCSKSMFEIDYGDVETWKRACEGFEGSWMWNLLVFPTSETQQCEHDLDVCRVCTQEHLRGALTSGGPSACDSMSCPQCNRNLTYQEIHRLADTATVAKYEKFMLQTFLSNDPNFRWCLSPLCETGQLYQTPPHDPHTTCEECQFDMCFTHEMPWHEGLTCEEFESQRDHGDPSFAQTREWIRTNTKPCPGCEVGIQKGEACFHMTCSQCNHEFCWQCLANWTLIRANGQEGHEEGCFFRTNDVRPTGLRGENLDEALRARSG